VELKSVIAARSEPGPLSAFVVTSTVPARAEQMTIAPKTADTHGASRSVLMMFGGRPG
jgi:hypothetical protein